MDPEPPTKKPRSQAQLDALAKGRERKGKARRRGKKRTSASFRPDGTNQKSTSYDYAGVSASLGVKASDSQAITSAFETIEREREDHKQEINARKQQFKSDVRQERAFASRRCDVRRRTIGRSTATGVMW